MTLSKLTQHKPAFTQAALSDRDDGKKTPKLILQAQKPHVSTDTCGWKEIEAEDRKAEGQTWMNCSVTVAAKIQIRKEQQFINRSIKGQHNCQCVFSRHKDRNDS